MKKKLLRRLTATLAVFFVFIGVASAQEGCLNVDQFPFSPAVPNADGTLTEIATCIYPQEFSPISGLIEGANYEFTVSAGAYMTIRSGTFDGPVVAQGYSPLPYTALDASDLFMHITINEACDVGTGCRESGVQLLLDCTPPTVEFNIQYDCDNLQYYVEVVVSDMGDAITVDIENDAGAAYFPGVGLGTYSVGPFPNLQAVQIYLRHSEDVLCSVLSPLLINSPCPVVSCGPDSYTYCANNLETTVFSFQGNSGFPLAMSFTGGDFNIWDDDMVTIHDGTDDLADVLFSGQNGGDMTGLLVISTNPDNALTMVLTTDFGTSCQDSELAPLTWDVQCLTCNLPQVEYSVVTDCDAFQFFVDVNITLMGTNPSILIINDGGAAELVANAAGTYQVGPFTAEIPVTITLIDGNDALCNRTSPQLVNPICAMPITCGVPGVESTYCYVANDSKAWSYVSDGGGTLRLKFQRGSIESFFWDQMRIYDGPDNSAPILFEHDTYNNMNFGPVGSSINELYGGFYDLTVYATGNELYMELNSDAINQCSTNESFDEWEWEVVCLDCGVPAVSATVVEDCDAGSFTVPVTVTSTGDGSSIDITYTVDGGAAEVLAGVGAGLFDLGPFPLGSVVHVSIQHESNALCNLDLGSKTDSGTCPTAVICEDGLQVTYCPSGMEDTFFYYKASGAFPLAVLFTAGELAECCDRLFVYDGSGDSAPELTPLYGVGGPLAGLSYFATNPDNILTIRINAYGDQSCQTGDYEALAWRLSCLDCIPAQATYEIVQDCENSQYFVDVNVISLGSDGEMELVFDNGTQSIPVTAPGTYQIGPFEAGTESQFVLVNDVNALCSFISPILVNDLCPTFICGGATLEETYCYNSFETKVWSYELPTPGTLRLTFTRGTIDSGFFDGLTIFDGPDNMSPVLFQHLNMGVWNLGPEGSAVINDSPNFYAVDVTATGSTLFMEMFSDWNLDCATSIDFDPWEWVVYCDGCVLPGVSYNAVPNCTDRTYEMEVAVTSVGADGLRVVNTFSGEEQVATAAGTLTFGPFAQDSPVAFELTALDNTVCPFYSDTLTYASEDCFIVSCGVDNYTHCYGNDEDRWYSFQAAIDVPITISFLEGQMLTGDRVLIYNGRDENAPLLYQGNNGGNLTGLAVNSNNVDNVITMHIQSNSTGSCADGGASPALRWDVACGAVGVEELGGGAFVVYPNPTNGLLYLGMDKDVAGTVSIHVFDISGQVVLQDQFAGQGGLRTIDMHGLMNGHYLVQLTTANWVKTQRVEVVR